MILENPELLERVMKAVKKGYEYAIENPVESVEILHKKAPENSPEFLRKSQQWLSPRYQADAPYWGYQELEVWEEFGEWMYEQGLITEKFDAEKAFTNEFLLSE